MHNIIKRFALWLTLLAFVGQPVLVDAQGIDPAARGLAVQAKAAAAQIEQAPRIRIASPMGGMYPQNSTLTNGTTQTSGTDRILFQLNSDYAWLAAVLVNGYSTSGNGALGAPGNAVTFRMTLEQGGASVPGIMAFPSPTTSAVSSGGKSGSVIGDGEIQVSAPTYKGAFMGAGSYQAIRFYKSVSAGQKWPITYGYGNYNNINGPVVPTGSAQTSDFVNGTTLKDGSDQTYQTAPTYGTFAGSSSYWAPLAIIGEQITPKVVIMAVGDSVSAGFGEAAGHGLIAKAAENYGIAYHNDGVPASTTFNLVNNFQGARTLAKYVDYIVFHTGSNDNATSVITTLDQFKTQLLQVAQTYSRKSNRLMFDTILPRTATTDSCATYANQTKPSWEALRIQENNWLRDKTATGAMAYFAANLKIGKVIAINDPTVQMERNADGTAVVLDSNGQQVAGTGGYFLIGNSTDCIHPNATGVPAAAAAIHGEMMVLPLFGMRAANDNWRHQAERMLG